MPAACSRATCRHSSSSSSSLTSSGLASSSGVDVGLAGDEQGVALGAEAGGDDLGHAHAGLRGHQRRQRLVLDLFQPSDGRAPRRIAVGEQPPATREALGVLCVSPQHANLQRSSVFVVPEVLRRADPLALRDPQVADVDAE